MRGRVVKVDKYWCWECRATCSRGGGNYRSWVHAHAAFLTHCKTHREFGFQCTG